MSSRWSGFLVWALVAATAAFWGSRLFAASRALPSDARVPVRTVAANTPMTRLFGALPEPDQPDAPPPESERFSLQGVIAEGDHGFAIVSIDGQPPKPWRVGAVVEGETTLLAVSRRAAEFGPRGGPSTFTLELPPPQAAATGTLPAATSNVQGGPRNAPPRGPLVPGVNAPGLVNRGVNMPVMPPRAMPQAVPQQAGDGGQPQQDEE